LTGKPELFSVFHFPQFLSVVVETDQLARNCLRFRRIKNLYDLVVTVAVQVGY